jgi:hypothetical protein
MSNLTFDIKDNDTKDIFDNNPLLINIINKNNEGIDQGINICTIRCGQEIDNCNSITINSMTNYGNILSLNTQSNNTCNVKIPYESEGDNKNYIFKNIYITVPSLHRIANIIYDMEIFIVFTAIQKNGTKLNLVLCSLFSGTDGVPASGDPNLLPYTLLNELFSGKNTVPEIHATNTIKLTPNPIDLSSFIPSVGNRSFYIYTHPKNVNTNIRVFKTTLNVSNSILSILKNKLTPGTKYANMKNTINVSLNPSNIFFYISEDITQKYTSFANNTVTKNKKEKYTNKKDTISTKIKKSSKKIQSNSIKYNIKKSSNKEKNDDDDDDDNDESIKDSDSDDSSNDSSNDSLDDPEALSKNIEKYDDSTDNVSKTADNFVDTDNKNIVSVIIYIGFVFISLLFLYIITNNCINNPSEGSVSQELFISMFKKSPQFQKTAWNKICFFILYIFCIILGLIMIIYLLIFFYNPTTFLIRSSSTLLFAIFIFIVAAFVFLGKYIYYRFETSKASDYNYSNCDNYTFKLFEWYSIKEILNLFTQNEVYNTETTTDSSISTTIESKKEPNKKENLKTENSLPGPNDGNGFSAQQTFENLGSIGIIMEKKPLTSLIFILFVLFIFILSCYLFPNYDNISSGYVKDFVRICGLTSVIYSFIYLVIYLISCGKIGYFINNNYSKIDNSKIIIIVLFIITLITIISIIMYYSNPKNKTEKNNIEIINIPTFIKAFLIFLLTSLCIFLVFMLYIIYQKYFRVKVDKLDIQENTNSNPRIEESSVDK